MRFTIRIMIVWVLMHVMTNVHAQFIVAHRGASQDAPENTLAAFRLAWERGADAIEGDFYVTKDEQIVCIHDKDTQRTAPGQPKLNVAEATAAELRRLDVGSWKDARYARERIPTLAEVLETVPAGKRIFVEVKCGPEILPHLKRELERSHLKPEQIVLISFSDDVISAARRLLPNYKANWLTGYKQDKLTRVWQPRLKEVLARLQGTGATGLGTQGNLAVIDESFAKRISEAGFELHIWTVNDVAQARRFAALGAASITTDRPALIAAGLRQVSGRGGSSTPTPFAVERMVMSRGYDGKECWVHARAGVLPALDASNPTQVVLTTQRLELSGSDVFHALHSSVSRDAGKTWSPLAPQDGFQRWQIEEGIEETLCDFTPQWHAASQCLLGIGQSVRYRDNKVMKVRPRYTGYSVFDRQSQTWSKPQRLAMPDDARFTNCGAGSVQRYDLPDGKILLPVYFKDPTKSQYAVTVCQCTFDGRELKYEKHGSELTLAVQRGLYEPSLTKFGDRYYLTLRNDEQGYVTSSGDGLNYDRPRPWTFDDGTDLGNYNTQQHWVTHRDGLYLVYTRKGANNDHVFRHRAPLFVAQVNPATLQVMRATEQILVPERGARLGNFGVVAVTANETWVVVTEWMQTWRRPSVIIPVDNKWGADNSIYIVKLKWTPHTQ